MSDRRLSLVLPVVCVAWLGGCSTDDPEGDGPNTPPEIAITVPVDGAEFPEGSTIDVTVQVTDVDEADLSTLTLVWGGIAAEVGPAQPDADGLAELTIEAPAVGTYEISVDVTDPDGASASASVGLTIEPDADRDGWSPPEDCNDDDPAVNPGAVELCNEIDDDCSGYADDGVTFLDWDQDADTDGYGNPVGPVVNSCEDLSPLVPDGTDCNDVDATIHPGAVEICNGKDEDCAGGADDGLTHQYWYADVDGDGYGNAVNEEWTCEDLSATHVLDGTDCNDIDATMNHDDADGDGYDSCAGDCEDLKPTVNPDGVEVCNDLDDNCAGGVDEGFVVSDWYADTDGDGYGNPAAKATSCLDLSATHVFDNTDCDDTDASLNHDDADLDGFDSCAGDCDDAAAGTFPGARESCNAIDDNCAGGIDEGVEDRDWYVDADLDGYGDPASLVVSCMDMSATHINDGTDCDDLDANMNHDDVDLDGIDSCDGDCDDLDPVAQFEQDWYTDADGDGYGDGVVVGFSCNAPGPGTAPASAGIDCDDKLDTVHPGAEEICGDGIDDDCNGSDGSCGPIGSFMVEDGPSWVNDPPVASCIETCATLFGGVETDYNCSTSKAVLDYSSFVSGWGDGTFCTNPVDEDFKKEDPANPGYNCGAVGCAYSAYVTDWCVAGAGGSATNYCWER